MYFTLVKLDIAGAFLYPNIIMKELIKIETDNQGNNLVSARELRLFLEVKTDFAKWCKRMFEYGFVDGKDYSLVKIGLQDSHGGSNKTDYALTVSCAKEIAMIQRTDKGKEARLYFIECEKQLKKQAPQTKLGWIKLALEQEEKVLALNNKVENLSTALDSLVEWVSIIKVAQFNKVKENNFNWRKLKNKSKDLGFGIKKAESPRFGYQNLYHVNAFKACYPQYKYDFI